jgi:hypothetical protein
MIGDADESDARARSAGDRRRRAGRLVDTGAGVADTGGVEVSQVSNRASTPKSRALLTSVTQLTPIWRRTSTATGGARQKNDLRGSGHRWPRAEMAHSRLSRNRSASAATATSSSLKRQGSGRHGSRSATPRPSILSPARASFTAYLPGSGRAEMAQEPVGGEAGDGFEGAGLFEQVGDARNDHQPCLASQLLLRPGDSGRARSPRRLNAKGYSAVPGRRRPTSGKRRRSLIGGRAPQAAHAAQ